MILNLPKYRLWQSGVKLVPDPEGEWIKIEDVQREFTTMGAAHQNSVSQLLDLYEKCISDLLKAREEIGFARHIINLMTETAKEWAQKCAHAENERNDALILADHFLVCEIEDDDRAELAKLKERIASRSGG